MAKHAALGLYTYAEFGALALAFLPPMALAWRQHRGDSTQRVPGRWMRRFGRTAARLTPLWSFRVEGEAPPDINERPYVVVANHESNADPFLLSFLPWDMRWIAKEELFRLPVLGKLMKYGGDIPLRRGQRDSIKQMLDECRRTMAAGMSIMMFPEGTRSRDGELLPFKEGAFELAIEAGVPVLPVAISGTRACMPKGSRWFGRAEAVARVLAPISTEGLGPDDVPALRDRTRDALAAALRELRARPAAG
ncbi:MAG TPA: lysophospholipid acyltransferase family protein [Polyangiaceae bacterium]|nr:lysophospholipid acyltransferase family protein [Polyangiaceae bacterium]